MKVQEAVEFGRIVVKRIQATDPKVMHDGLRRTGRFLLLAGVVAVDRVPVVGKTLSGVAERQVGSRVDLYESVPEGLIRTMAKVPRIIRPPVIPLAQMAADGLHGFNGILGEYLKRRRGEDFDLPDNRGKKDLVRIV